MTRQAFNILPNIREADRLITPKLQERVYEVHPEVVFKALAGRAMGWNKKPSKDGGSGLDCYLHTFQE